MNVTATFPLVSVLAILSGFLMPGSAKELEGVHSAAAGPCPTVDEAIAKMKVPDGYAVRCFASEPMIINPVAMTWDHRGRLWVVELYEYPSGAAKPNAYSTTSTDEQFRPVIPQEKDSPRDRVIILEDTDNDGKADKRTVFAEGLNLATALLCGHGGVFIGQAPNLFFFRDTDGDDKADEYKTVLTGFGLEDRHELLNSFTWGPDGWMYFTHGVFTHSKVRRPTEPPDKGNTLNAGVYRVRFGNRVKEIPRADLPDAERIKTSVVAVPSVAFHEVYADGTSNPWGVDFDTLGNAFVEACVIDHFFHMAPGGLYARQGGAPENPYGYDLLPSIVGKDHPGHFRAAFAGIAIYQGGVYPADTHGHAFFGNIHDNAIHEEAMDPIGATFKARPIRDFLRANDGWFRPVSIQTGPDGFLWVMDWCDKYPCYQNALANPEGVDREKGRIWRVCYEGSGEGKILLKNPRGENPAEIGNLEPGKKVNLLDSDNNWLRRTAAQLIREEIAGLSGRRPPQKSLEERKKLSEDFSAYLNPLLELSRKSTKRSTKLAANSLILELKAWRQINGSNQSQLEFFAPEKDPDPAIRILAARYCGDTAAEGWPSNFTDPPKYLYEELAGDPDPTVRHAAAVALRQLSRDSLTADNFPDISRSYVKNAIPMLIRASAANADRTLAFSIWSLMEGNLKYPAPLLESLSGVAPTTKPLSLTLTNKSARRIIDTRSPANVDLLLAFLDQIKDHDDLTAAALEGILKASEAGPVKPEKTDPAPFFVRWSQSPSPDVKNRAARLATLWGDPAAVAAVIAEAANATTPLPRRIELLETLRKLRTPATKQAVLDLLTAGGPDNWIIPVLRAAAEVGSGDEFSTPVLKLWPKGSPALHTAAAQFLTGRAEWQQRLLAAVEKPDPATGVRIPAGELPATTRRYFATSSDPATRATAERVIGRWSDSTAETKTLIAAKRKALIEGEPDMAMGKVLFQAICATCHKFHGGGQEVGPELIGSGRSNLDAILANVIDPNQIIGNGYQNFLITTKDGRTLGGRIIEDTPTQVTLLGIGGSREVVPTGDIAKREDTGLSLMPMGFGNLPDDQLRNLIWYLLAPPEEGTLTKEKKEAFIKGAEAEAPTATPVNTTASPGPRIDWESVSLWKPDWRIRAPEFEGTPRKLAAFSGRNNVLQLHPFPDRKKPATLSRKYSVPATGQPTLSFDVTAQDPNDWELVVRINDKEIKRQTINAEGEPWKNQSIDLRPWSGQTIGIQLENHANGWAWEFSYWSELKIIP